MRKVFELEPETIQGLKQFADDSGRTLDDLAEEAFGLLLKKHCRPRTLKEAFQMSLRQFARNDNETSESEKRAR
jgi:non-ribosomal peptide synthetase component F